MHAERIATLLHVIMSELPYLAENSHELRVAHLISGPPRTADIGERDWHVAEVPKSDVHGAAVHDR